MTLIIQLFLIDIIFPLAFTLVFYLKLKKYLWVVPVAFFTVEAFLLLKDILGYMSNQTFNEQIRLYFVNDSSMGLYLIYLPMFLTSLGSTFLCYIVDMIKKQFDKVDS